MPVKKIDAEKSKREAFRLYEEVMQYFKAHAMQGDFWPDDYVRARAAFDVANVEALRELCDFFKCEVEFVSVEEALKAHLPRMKPVKLENGKTRKFKMEDYSQADRVRILPTIPGTEAFAAAQMAAHDNGTPFDA